MCLMFYIDVHLYNYMLQYVAPKIGVCPDYILGDLGKPAPNPIVYKTIRSETGPMYVQIHFVRMLMY